jgi:tetratricopeptide (TPR) repeat protein
MIDPKDQDLSSHIKNETRVVAMTKASRDEIDVTRELNFTQSYDDLDYLEFAKWSLTDVVDNSVMDVVFVHHKHSPYPGMEIFVGPLQDNIPYLLYLLSRKLGISLDDFEWIHSEYIDETYKIDKVSSLLERIGVLKQFGYHLKLSPISLPEEVLKEHLKNKNLSGFSFDHLGLKYADYSGATLNGASFKKAELENADLENADVRLANFIEANLRKVNFKGADLRGANLKGSNLSFAQFDGKTELKSANFHGAECDSIVSDGTMWLNVIGLHTASGIPSSLLDSKEFKYGLEFSRAIGTLSSNRDIAEFYQSYKRIINDISQEREYEKALPSLWNKMAWIGCLYSSQSNDQERLRAARMAVSLNEKKGNYHDTLSMIYALEDKKDEAIKELSRAIESEDVKNNWLPDLKDMREKWLSALRAGQNPFSEEEIKELRTIENID